MGCILVRSAKVLAVRLISALILSVFGFYVPLLAQVLGRTDSKTSLIAKEPVISAHELSIPKKAKKELANGVRKLLKREVEGSLRDFAAAIEIYPDYYEAYYHQGIAQTILKQNDQALKSFQNAINVSEGKFPQAEFGYGLVLCREGRAEEGEVVIRHGMKAAPCLSDGYVILGVAMLKQSRLDEAERMARESLAMTDTGEGKGYLPLADIHSERKDYRSQAQDLSAYLKIHPNDPDRKILEATRDVAQSLAERMQQGTTDH